MHAGGDDREEGLVLLGLHVLLDDVAQVQPLRLARRRARTQPLRLRLPRLQLGREAGGACGRLAVQVMGSAQLDRQRRGVRLPRLGLGLGLGLGLAGLGLVSV